MPSCGQHGVLRAALGGVAGHGRLSIGVALVQAMGSTYCAISAAIFIGAWIAQFVGPPDRGGEASFFEDLQYLWVGPLFVLGKLYRKLDIRW